MEFNWFPLFNRSEFEELGLVSRTLTVTLEGIGEKEILITQGNELAITYEGIFLPVSFTDKNPFVKEGHAIFEDSNENIFLGIEIEEDE